VLLLQTIDDQWKDHLLSIDHLKEGIGMRAYGQRNPKEEYKREAFGLFMEMMGRIRQEVVNKLFRVQLVRDEEVSRMEEEQRRERNALTRLAGPAPATQAPVKRDTGTVGRNDPCPCGSGKKYKKCCGQ
jgi:preprotein translocase subunit SecA